MDSKDANDVQKILQGLSEALKSGDRATAQRFAEQLRGGASASSKRIDELEARVEHLESMFDKLNSNDKAIVKQVKDVTSAHNRLKDRFDVGGLTGELERQLKKLVLWRKRFVRGRLKYRQAKREFNAKNA